MAGQDLHRHAILAAPARAQSNGAAAMVRALQLRSRAAVHLAPIALRTTRSQYSAAPRSAPRHGAWRAVRVRGRLLRAPQLRRSVRLWNSHGRLLARW